MNIEQNKQREVEKTLPVHYIASAAIAAAVGIAVGLLLGHHFGIAIAIAGGFAAMIATGLVLTAMHAFVDLGLQVEEKRGKVASIEVKITRQEKLRKKAPSRKKSDLHQESVVQDRLQVKTVKQRIEERLKAGESILQLIETFGRGTLDQEYGRQNVANALNLDKWAEQIDRDLEWLRDIHVDIL